MSGNLPGPQAAEILVISSSSQYTKGEAIKMIAAVKPAMDF
jgi:hypothetical protein